VVPNPSHQAPRPAAHGGHHGLTHPPTIGAPQRRLERRQDGDRRQVDVGPPAGLEDRRVAGRRSSDVPKPKCPFCGASDSTVCKTPRRAPARSDKYDRRRECTECGRRFPTEEKLDLRRFERELALEGLTLADLGIRGG
jgi:hypothetical protein